MGMSHPWLRNAPAALLVIVVSTVSGSVLAGAQSRPVRSHTEIDCTDCHTLAARSAETILPASAGSPDPGSARCRSCHFGTGRAGAEEGPAFHAEPRRPCVDCHSFHDPAVLMAGSVRFRFDHEDPAAAARCAACHAADSDLKRLSPGHRAASEIYHRDASFLAEMSLSEACLACHASGARSELLAGLVDDVIPINVHASHPIGIRVIPGSGNARNHIRHSIDPRIPLFEGRIECQSCHDITNPADDALIAFENKYELCLGCHQHNP
ncbi:MAG: hypothetical protein GF355_09950 [Candidatus Eisenbacteria bacterium]|nr:hypothetical protein [Candidatus Eisenbacteria bacterium]